MLTWEYTLSGPKGEREEGVFDAYSSDRAADVARKLAADKGEGWTCAYRVLRQGSAFVPYKVGFLGPPTDEETEMARLLDLIDAEWRSDPASVACFDARTVQGVRLALDKHRQRVKASGVGPAKK